MNTSPIPTVEELTRMTPSDGDTAMCMIENIDGEHHIVGMVVSSLNLKQSAVTSRNIFIEIMEQLTHSLKTVRLSKKLL